MLFLCTVFIQIERKLKKIAISNFASHAPLRYTVKILAIYIYRTRIVLFRSCMYFISVNTVNVCTCAYTVNYDNDLYSFPYY